MDESVRLERAVQAEKIIKSDLFQEAFEQLRLALLTKFEAAPVRDNEGREHIHKMLKALTDAKGHLEQVMNDGKVVLHLQEEKRRFALFRK